MPQRFNIQMELRQLKYFIEVAKELHFGKAAEKLCISQPALTKQINLIEAELGIELFDKAKRLNHKKVALTEAGRFLLRDAIRFSEQFDRMLENTKKVGQKNKQLLLGIYRLMTKSHVAQITKLLLDKNPNTAIKLIEYQTSVEVQEGLIKEEIDLGITHLPLLYKGLSYDYYEESYLKVILPINHPLANYKKIKIEQLRNEKWIEVNKAIHIVYDEIERRCRAIGFSREANIIQEVTSIELLISLVGIGIGIGVIPSYVIINDVGVVAKDLEFSDDIANAKLILSQIVAFKK